MTYMRIAKAALIMALITVMSGCASQESHHAITPEKVASYGTVYTGPKSKIVVGQFDNTSSYMRGIFSDGIDRLGKQGKDILITHLQQTGRFSVLDRKNMSEMKAEAGLTGRVQHVKGANYVLTGEVAEFGRKEQGDVQLFGMLGAGKNQIAYAKVNLKIVDVDSSEIIFSTQGEGEYQLSDREVLGFGSTSSYDSTLNGKVLDLAIREAVNRLVEGLERGQWSPAHE